MEKKSNFPLSFGNIGQTYEISALHGDDKTAKHLREIGFYSGAKITIESKTGGGLMIKIGETKLALDLGICNKIYISEPTKTNEQNMEM